MATSITDLDVSINPTQEQKLEAQGFKKNPVNLNAGTKGNQIFLWYKKTGPNAITRLQVTFNDEMANGLINAGYTKINNNLNHGAGGNSIYLWYFRGSTVYDTPIVEINATTKTDDEPQMFAAGWERLACDLNRHAGGNWIHLWVKRKQQTYICDVIATDDYSLDGDNFQAGYIRVDEVTNRGAGGASVFIWYRQTTDPKRALIDLQVSITQQEYQQYQQQEYRFVDVKLNQGNGTAYPVYLWFKKEGSNNPIKAIMLLLQNSNSAFEKAGVTVIPNNLNSGNNGSTEYICVNQ